MDNCKKLKEYLLELDKKLAKHFAYQEKVILEYDFFTNKKLSECILQERKPYEEYYAEHFPIDIKKFVSFKDDTWNITKTLLRFDEKPPTKIFSRLHEYNNKETSLLFQLNALEDKYKTIYDNCPINDHYVFSYTELIFALFFRRVFCQED